MSRPSSCVTNSVTTVSLLYVTPNQATLSHTVADTLNVSIGFAETEKKVDELFEAGEKAAKPGTRFRGKRIGAISDIGMFINSINNAVRIVRDVGVNVERTDIDNGDTLEITIKVPKTLKAAK